MRRRRILVSVVAVGALLGAVLGVGGATPAFADDPAVVGMFSAPFAENPAYGDGLGGGAPPDSVAESLELPTAVSIATLPFPDGKKYVYWNGLEHLEDADWPLIIDATRVAKNSRTRLLDLASGTPAWDIPDPEDGDPTADDVHGNDLFCTDQRILLDGTVMAVGGTEWDYAVPEGDLTPITGATGPGGPSELFGHTASRIYRYNNNGGTWTRTADMNHGRWYPTLLTLPDGKLLVASGVGRLVFNDQGTNVHQTETFNPFVNGDYDPANGTWTDNGPSGEASFPLFTRLFLLANKKVFYTANGQMWGPFGQSFDEALWNIYKLYDPVANSWADAGLAPFGAVNGAGAALLPFEPDDDLGNYSTSKVLLAGGTLGTSPGGWLATPLTQIITVDGDDVSTERGPDLKNARWYSSTVSAPTGEVFLFNGADKDEVQQPGLEKAIRKVEVYDPDANTWTELASSARDRTYHNSAILLSDGRVLVGGHSPINALYGGGEIDSTGLDNNGFHRAAPDQFANNFKDPSFEIYSPPYLFRGPRPTISGVSGIFEWGSERLVQTDTPAQISKAVLVKVPETTHVTDADMRVINLKILGTTSGGVNVRVPANRAVAPPGFYYLFVLRDNGQGPTPSEGAIVRVGDAGVFPASVRFAPAILPEPKAPSLAGVAAAKAAPAATARTPISTSVVDAADSRPVSSTMPATTLAVALSIGAAAFGAVAVRLRRPRRSSA